MSRAACLFVSSCVSCGLISGAAKAAELVIPFVPGITIGSPAGRAPPPGFYSQTTVFCLQGAQIDGRGHVTNRKFRELEIAETLLASTTYQFLGARYWAYVIQPFKSPTTTTAGQTIRTIGAFNTILSPFNLSWDLGNALGISYGATYYLPDGTYDAFGSRVANGFFTFEQNVGMTLQKSGYTLSANAVLDVNAINATTDYRSGSVLDIDLTATKSFGNLSIGIGGYYVDQFENDRQFGHIVAATSYNGIGNRWQEAALGPYASYDLGAALVSAWYTRDAYARNTVKAGTGWLRVRVPLGTIHN